jgi:hypothetical protein
MVPVTEEPLRAGWIYPCSVQEIQDRLSRLPPEDLEGIAAVELVPATRYEYDTYGEYFPEKRPTIHIYAQPKDLAFRTRFGRRHIACCLGDQVRFGLKVEDRGPRLLCTWDPTDLRVYVLEFVIPHEIGHHVCHQRRTRKNQAPCPGPRECERFADEYARQHCKAPPAAEQLTG